MFCSCRTSFGEEPNSNVCPTCMGLPGALPVLNKAAIEQTILAGLLLDCTTPEISKWDRKNYFYPECVSFIFWEKLPSQKLVSSALHQNFLW